MAGISDPTRLEAYKDALGNWSYDGYIRFELTETAYAWIKRELDDLSLKEIGRLMHQHVDGGGEIDEVRECDPSGRITSSTTTFGLLFKTNPSKLDSTTANHLFVTKLQY